MCLRGLRRLVTGTQTALGVGSTTFILIPLSHIIGLLIPLLCMYYTECCGAPDFQCSQTHTHTTRLLTDLHWLPVIARIKFKTLVLAYQAIKGSAPAYIQQLIRPYTPARPLRSATSGRLAPPARHTCTARFTTALCSGPTMVE